MRLRNVKAAFERIDQFEYIVTEPMKYKGKWASYFGNDNPIHIEIGMGKGQFLLGHARRNPNINYIGFEKFTVVLVKALERFEKEEEAIPNLCVVRFDAAYLLDIFETNEVSNVFLNFSDPWPKERHFKRRLTYRDFLGKYKEVLSDQGSITFKTDNDPLFEFSLEEMKAVGMHFPQLTRDLHKSEWLENNVMTEYEVKFHEQGITINMVQACF